jgi:hypothetical protein
LPGPGSLTIQNNPAGKDIKCPVTFSGCTISRAKGGAALSDSVKRDAVSCAMVDSPEIQPEITMNEIKSNLKLYY